MSDILVLLESASSTGQFVLVALFAVALGFLIFDRGVRSHRRRGATRTRDRMAA